MLISFSSNAAILLINTFMPGSGAAAQTMVGGGGGRGKSVDRIANDVRADCYAASKVAGVARRTSIRSSLLSRPSMNWSLPSVSWTAGSNVG